LGEVITAYGLQLVVGLIALFALWKDWHEYRKRSKAWGRPAQVVLAFAAILFIVLSLLDTHYNRANSASEKSYLLMQVQQLRADSKVANDGFRQSFASLYDKFGQLQTRVQTDALLKQNTSLLLDIDATKRELASTRAKLEQPQTTPLASFQTEHSEQIPITEATLERSSPVPVSFLVYNPSAINALNGSINVDICRTCAFASEPIGFARVAGAAETQRSLDFQHIYAKSAAQLLTLSLKVPPEINRFEIGVRVNCETCTPAEYQQLWVNLK
jgi:hypothetical protein